MTTKTVPFATGLHIEKFVGASITEASSELHNMIIDRYDIGGDGRVYITQRPGLDLSLDVSEESGIDAKGRGIYYWADANNPNRYFCCNDDLFAGTSNIGSISTGTEPVTFLEGLDGSGNKVLGVFDPENSTGHWLNTSNSLTEITDVDFPPKQTPAKSLAYGAVNLDGYTVVLTTDGQLWNSDLDNMTSWNSLNFLEAERENDDGVCIVKHHDHIVALGGRTIEFFYNAANPSGSPLSRRNDLFYNVGCADGASVWTDGDVIYFLGINTRGTLGIYKIENFRVDKISMSTLDSYLTQSRIRDSMQSVGTGFSAHGHTFYTFTLYADSGTGINPEITLVYDTVSQQWGTWDTELTELSGVNGFPLVDWSIRTGTAPRFGEGILSNGDIITINDSLTPLDSLASQEYFDNSSGLYVEAGYYTDAPGSGTDIAFHAKISHVDCDTPHTKFVSATHIFADPTDNSQTLTVEWSDDHDHDTFSSSRTIDLSTGRKLTRCGSFNRRTFKLSGTMSETVRIEGLQLNYSVGSH